MGPSAFLLLGVDYVSLCSVVGETAARVVLQHADVLFIWGADLMERPFSDSIRFFKRFADA